MNIDDARKLLYAAEVFHDVDDDTDIPQLLNLNDAFYWACGDAEKVADDELQRVADLFFNYGMNGIYYWVLIEKRGTFPVEFHDVNRAVEFVQHEEQLRKEIPSSSQRAYAKRIYTIGDTK